MGFSDCYGRLDDHLLAVLDRFTSSNIEICAVVVVVTFIVDWPQLRAFDNGLTSVNRTQSMCACGFVIYIALLYVFKGAHHAKLSFWACSCDICIGSRSPLTMTRGKCLTSANRTQSASARGFVIDTASIYVYKVEQHAKLRFEATHSISTNPGIFALSAKTRTRHIISIAPAIRDSTVAMCIETLLTILRGPYWEASKRIRSPRGIPI